MKIKKVLLSLFLVILSSASLAKDKSQIGILVFDKFLTSDVTAPIEVFGAAVKHDQFSEYEVVLISATKNLVVTSEEGLKIVADKSIYDALNLKVLLVPSAYDMSPYLEDKKLVQFIRDQSKKVDWNASNCSGAFLLGAAGVLDGKKATTWAGGENDLQKSYPEVNVQYDENVVLDAGVVTSNGGPISYQAAFELLAALSDEKFANQISELIQFNRLENAF